jgi:hypothetical protein
LASPMTPKMRSMPSAAIPDASASRTFMVASD